MRGLRREPRPEMPRDQPCCEGDWFHWETMVRTRPSSKTERSRMKDSMVKSELSAGTRSAGMVRRSCEEP